MRPTARIARNCLLLLGVGAAGFALALVGTGCKGWQTFTVANLTDLSPNSQDRIRQTRRGYLNGKVVYEVQLEYTDPAGYVSGSIRFTPTKGSSTQLAPFRKATISGRGDANVAANILKGSLLAVVQGPASAGSFCVSLTGKTVPDHPTQVVVGRFTVLGGTAKGATIHADGTFLAIHPKVPPMTDNASGAMTIFLAAKHLSTGAPRGLSAACRAAAKPPAPPPTKASLTLDGFVFAPAGATAVPTGATVFPDGASITGAVGCGADNNIYVVVTYAGPASKASGFLSGPVGATVMGSVKAGKNVIFLVRSPANGVYDLKLGVVGAAGFGSEFALQRTC